MTKSQAKKLKVGDMVVWRGEGNDGVVGLVARKRYNTIWIKWDDGVERTHYADTMENVWTEAQLAALDEQRRVAEKVKEINREGLKQPYKGY